MRADEIGTIDPFKKDNTLAVCEEIRKIDKKGNEVYIKDVLGFEVWRAFDENDNCTFYRNSTGFSYAKVYNKNGECIHYKDTNGLEWYTVDGEKVIIDNEPEQKSKEQKDDELLAIGGYFRLERNEFEEILKDSVFMIDRKEFYSFWDKHKEAYVRFYYRYSVDEKAVLQLQASAVHICDQALNISYYKSIYKNMEMMQYPNPINGSPLILTENDRKETEKRKDVFKKYFDKYTDNL